MMVGLTVGGVIGYACAWIQYRRLRVMNARLRRRNLALVCRLMREGFTPEPPLDDAVRIHVLPPGRFA